MTGETHSTHVPSATCRTDEAPQNVLTIELPDRALYTLSKISIAKWCIQPRLKEEVARVENKPWHTIADIDAITDLISSSDVMSDIRQVASCRSPSCLVAILLASSRGPGATFSGRADYRLAVS